MKKNNLFITTVAALAAITFLAASPVNASYGPTTPPEIVVDKMVTVPGTDNYVDNLSQDDKRYIPNQDVWFKVTIRNSTNETLRNVELVDTMPSEVTVLGVGNGSYNPSTHEVKFTFDSLAPNETKTVFIAARVKSASSLPSDKSVLCTLNKVRGKGSVNNATAEDSDTAQFCIEITTEKKVLGVTTIPKTGPEAGLAMILGQVALLAAGLRLRKVA